MASNNTKKIILAKPVDWDPWISFVQNRAKASTIWDLVDPSLPERPQQLHRPTKPVFVRPFAGGLIDASLLEIYKIDMSEYKSDLAEYEQQEKAFGDLIIFIQETIAAHNVIFIQKEDSHPWSILRALKNRLAPSDTARNLAIEQKYHKLCKGPGTQDLEAWIDQWITNYTEAKEIGIGEVAGTRPIRDFLMAIRAREPTYADAHLVFLDTKKPDDLYGLIENFRQHIRLQNLQNPKGGEHTAFATKSGGASFRGQSQSSQPSLQPSKACICGEMHWLSDCYFLVPEKRPSGWKPNPNKQKKVDEALKDNRTKTWVERVLQKSKQRGNQAGNQNSSSGPSTPTPASTGANSAAYAGDSGAFICSSFSTVAWHLQDSWILDNGSNSHVCNRTMLSRFTKTREAGPNDKLTAGTQVIPIECFGTITIGINTPTGLHSMTLLNVAYVSSFMTNLVSQSILRSKGLYFDDWKMHLHREGKTVGFVEEHKGHHIIENNMVKATASTTTTTTAPSNESSTTTLATAKSGTINDWHQILSHPSHEAIKHLENASQGVKVLDNARVPKTNESKTCALSKLHRIVSRSLDKSESSDKPFHRVTYDIPPLNPATQVTEIESDIDEDKPATITSNTEDIVAPSTKATDAHTAKIPLSSNPDSKLITTITEDMVIPTPEARVMPTSDDKDTPIITDLFLSTPDFTETPASKSPTSDPLEPLHLPEGLRSKEIPISAKMDTTIILSKGVTSTIQQTRDNTYTITFDTTAQRLLDTFHIAFSAFPSGTPTQKHKWKSKAKGPQRLAFSDSRAWESEAYWRKSWSRSTKIRGCIGTWIS